jgi:hypothetical protein
MIIVKNTLNPGGFGIGPLLPSNRYTSLPGSRIIISFSFPDTEDDPDDCSPFQGTIELRDF